MRAPLIPCLVVLVLGASPACKRDSSGARWALSGEGAHGTRGNSLQELLTEDRVDGYLAFQKRIAHIPGEAVLAWLARNPTMPESQKVGDAGREKRPKIAQLSEAAVRESGLSREEIVRLDGILSPYYASVFPLAGYSLEMSAGGEKRASATPQQAAQLQEVQRDFATRYGARALEIVSKRERDFWAVHEQRTKLAFGGMKEALE